MKRSGIYCIENIVTGQKYIGKSFDVNDRMTRHKNEFRKKKHVNPYFQHSYHKYGEENFKFYIVELCPKEQLIEREIFYIKEWNTKFPNGYNMTDGGEGVPGLKIKRTPEQIEAMRIRQTGRVYGEETRRKHREAMKNRPNPCAAALKEKNRRLLLKRLEAEKCKKEEVQKEKWGKGSKWSKESIEKREKTKREKRELEKQGLIPVKEKKIRAYTEEHKQKLRESMTGNTYRVGLKLSPETIAKREASRKITMERQKREKEEKQGNVRLEGIE